LSSDGKKCCIAWFRAHAKQFVPDVRGRHDGLYTKSVSGRAIPKRDSLVPMGLRQTGLGRDGNRRGRRVRRRLFPAPR